MDSCLPPVQLLFVRRGEGLEIWLAQKTFMKYFLVFHLSGHALHVPTFSRKVGGFPFMKHVPMLHLAGHAAHVHYFSRK